MVKQEILPTEFLAHGGDALFPVGDGGFSEESDRADYGRAAREVAKKRRGEEIFVETLPESRVETVVPCN